VINGKRVISLFALNTVNELLNQFQIDYQEITIIRNFHLWATRWLSNISKWASWPYSIWVYYQFRK